MNITHADYYETVPQGKHRTGDIWTGLPTHGMLGKKTLPGIVITPACDLANSKAETISYLPILPLKDYLYTSCHIAKVKGICKGCEQILEISEGIVFEGFQIVSSETDVDGLIGVANQKIHDNSSESKAYQTAKKYICTLNMISEMKSSSPKPNIVDFNTVHGKKNVEYITQIIRNSFSPDVHFLPRDRQAPPWSGVPEHSVVMFRYPLTAPVAIFDLAQGKSDTWDTALAEIEGMTPLAGSFKHELPMKKLYLKPRIMADLISRYVSLYVRLGSPDLSPFMVDQYVQEVTNV